MKRILLLPVLLLTFPLLGYTQEVISSSGGYGQNAQVTAAWTLGELMTETFISQNLMLTQGFHQSNLGSSGIRDQTANDSKIAVFPNPVDYNLNLVFREDDFSGSGFRLIDFTGRVLITGRFDSSSIGIDVSFLASGTYMVQVTGRDGRIIQNTQIIKQ